MAAITATVYNQSHKKVSEVDLPESVFGATNKISLVHEVIRQQMASKRLGTHFTKSKGLVRGGGKKPFKQKGTGNARQGSSRSPLLVGGGVAFGPKPRDYSYQIPKKKKWKAISILLSNRFKDGKLLVVDKLEIKDGKTRSLVDVLKTLKIENGLIVDNKNEMLQRAARNIEKIKYLSVNGVNPYDIIRRHNIILTKSALESLIVRDQESTK